MPSDIACKIERLFAESQLMGPPRRLADIVDDVLAGSECRRCGGDVRQSIFKTLRDIAAQHSADPVLANFEQGVRDGIAKAEANQEPGQ